MFGRRVSLALAALAVVLTAVAGWVLGGIVTAGRAGGEEGPVVMMFLDTWGRVAGPDAAFQSLRLEENPNIYDPESDVTFYCEYLGGDPVPQRVYGRGYAHKDTGRVYQFSVYAEPVGRIMREKQALLRPFFLALFGVLDPSLTPEERTAMLTELELNPEDVEGLLRTGGRSPRLIRNGVEYTVTSWGSEEGGTVELTGVRLDDRGEN